MNALMGSLAGANPPTGFPGAGSASPGIGGGGGGQTLSGATGGGGASPFGTTRQATIRFDMTGGRGRVFFTSGGSAGGPPPFGK